MAKTAKQYANEFANMDVDYQGILDKFNSATNASYAQRRAQLARTENKFYDQMYDTQRTALDTIRQSNARAVSTGASRGMQAANELSAILGLQEQTQASANELMEQSTKLAEEETQATLENISRAYAQAKQEQQQNWQMGLQAAEADRQEEAQTRAQIQRYEDMRIQARKDGDALTELNAIRQLQMLRNSTDLVNMSEQEFLQNLTDFGQAIETIFSSDTINYKGIHQGTLQSVLPEIQTLFDTADLTNAFNAKEYLDAVEIAYRSNYGGGPDAKMQAVKSYAKELFSAAYRAQYNNMHNDYDVNIPYLGRGYRKNNPAYKPASEKEVQEFLTGYLNSGKVKKNYD